MSQAIIFYDGECGLCHFWVQFVLPRDLEGRFQFAPLQSERGSMLVQEAGRAFENTLLLQTEDGTLCARSDAVAFILKSCGGFWAFLGKILSGIPRVIREAGYRTVASMRTVFFRRPTNLCPVVPPQYRERFLS